MSIGNEARQLSFLDLFTEDVLDPNHKLVRLAKQIDWVDIHCRLRPYYSKYGRKGLPVRLMAGLQILKHMENMSDEKSVKRLSGDLYWMHFCGVDLEALQGKYKHLDESSMTTFRKRLGAEGLEVIEDVIQEHLVKEKKIDPKAMATDSTCMEKNIAYPTDSGLLNKGRQNLLKGMERLKKLGVKAQEGVRSYSRRSKQIILQMMKLGKDRADRIKSGSLELASQAVHVLGKSKKMLNSAKQFTKKKTLGALDQLKLKDGISYLKEQQKLLKRVIEQTRKRLKDGEHIKNKVYSMHEPEVICISKGKRSKANEYGSKVNLSIDKHGYIVSHETYSEAKGDAKLLEEALKNWEAVTGRLPKQANADRGYAQKKKERTKGRIGKISRLCIPNKGNKKHPDSKETWFKKGQRMRAGIEAVIGHLKQDHRMDRSRYSGLAGDKINVILASLAWNLNKLAKDTG